MYVTSPCKEQRHLIYSSLHQSSTLTHLVRPEPGVVQLLDRILHVVAAQELHHSSAVLVRVRETDVARLPHVVLEILPRPGVGQSRDHDAVLGSLRSRSIAATTASPIVTTATGASSSATTTAPALTSSSVGTSATTATASVIAAPSSSSAPNATAAAATAPSPTTGSSGELHTQPVPIVVVAIASLYCIFGIATISECN